MKTEMRPKFPERLVERSPASQVELPPTSSVSATDLFAKIEELVDLKLPKGPELKRLDDWVSREWLANRYECTVRTIKNWEDKAAFPEGTTFGSFKRWKLEDVLAWEAEQNAKAREASA